MSDTKRCCTCGEVKGLVDFHKYSLSPDGLQPACRSCKSAHTDARTVAGEFASQGRLNRFKAVTLLGGCCVVCGTTKRLEIDHVNNDGSEDRPRGSGHTGRQVVRYHAEHGLAATLLRFQLLCKPHHTIKTWHAWKGIPWPKIETAHSSV